MYSMVLPVGTIIIRVCCLLVTYLKCSFNNKHSVVTGSEQSNMHTVWAIYYYIIHSTNKT